MILIEISMCVTVLFFTFAMKQFIFIKLQFQFFVCRKNLIHRVCSIAMYHSDHKESACSAGEPGPIPWLEDPLEKKMAAPSRFLPGESHRQRNLEGYRPCVHKESDTTKGLTFLLF